VGALCVLGGLALISGCGKDSVDRHTSLSDLVVMADENTAENLAEDVATPPAPTASSPQIFAGAPEYPTQFRRGPIQFGAGGFVQRPPIAQAPQSDPPLPPVRPRLAEPMPAPGVAPYFGGRTELVNFDHSPFPFEGSRPDRDTEFFDVKEQARRGHRTASGRIYWANETYNERRSLLHVPEGFDPDRPSVLVFFFHGHRARLERDIRDRYLVAEQISASGMNAVIVAPQFAVEANDSSIGRFWEPGFMKLYLDEAAQKLSRMIGRPEKRLVFERIPIIVVGYSGGFEPTGQALRNSGLRQRISGVVLLDAAYGQFDVFSHWMSASPEGFFLSAYTSSTAPGNRRLMDSVSEAGQSYITHMPAKLQPGSRIFILAPVSHESYVTQSWTQYPLADMLRRLPDLPRRRGGEDLATSSIPLRSRYSTSVNH
jgi:hypothetical protein